MDGDSGNNARVTYRVSSSDGDRSLDVHPTTGWVYVKGLLDRETQDTYEMTVVASDNGSPSPLAATVVVVITVADVNDNDPEFDRDHYEFHVEENRPAGTTFGAVFASDRDAGDNALVRYSLIPTNSSFNINLYSGKCNGDTSFLPIVDLKYFKTIIKTCFFFLTQYLYVCVCVCMITPGIFYVPTINEHNKI